MVIFLPLTFLMSCVTYKKIPTPSSPSFLNSCKKEKDFPSRPYAPTHKEQFCKNLPQNSGILLSECKINKCLYITQESKLYKAEREYYYKTAKYYKREAEKNNTLWFFAGISSGVAISFLFVLLL